MRKVALVLALAIAAGQAHAIAAQSPAMKPFELNMEQVEVRKFGGKFSDSRTFFVPTYTLVVSVHGSVWAKKGGAQSHGKFFVEGMTQPLMHELATKLQTDLVTRMRAAGLTVLTYDDLKDHPDVAGRGRDKVDEQWGFPIRHGTPLAYIIAAPTEAQQFNNPGVGAAWPFHGLAKEKNLMVLSPEVTFTVPQMWGQTRAGYATNSAGIATDPAMKLESGWIAAVNAKGGTVNILIKEHGTRLAAENAGTIKQLSEKKYSISKEWQRTSGDYSMTLDPVAFTDGIMRVGLAINTMILSEIAKAQK
jgi:hypothetical protein